MKHCASCTCCDVDAVAKLEAECQRCGIHVRFPDLVSESGAAKLLGYASADTLRKQNQEYRQTLECVRRGNRRFYSLKDIARNLSQ